VPLLAAKDFSFARYRLQPGVGAVLAAIAAWIANMILAARGAHFHPGVGLDPHHGFCHFAVLIGILVLVVMGIINAANGVCKPLPLIGNRPHPLIK